MTSVEIERHTQMTEASKRNPTSKRSWLPAGDGVRVLRRLHREHQRTCLDVLRNVFCVATKRGANFFLSIIAFLYVLYATLIFFCVILMWVFSILVTIYVSVLTDAALWAQVFAVGLGIPLIGPIVNVLEESLIICLRTIRMGFQNQYRSSIFEQLCVPSTYSDIYFTSSDSGNSLRSAKAAESKRERLAGNIITFLERIPPSSFPFQSKLAFALVFVDILTVIVFIACSKEGFAYTIRSYVCLFVMLGCAIMRFARSCPTTLNDCNERLSASKSVRWVRYTTLLSAFFVIVSCTSAGLFAHRPKIYEFTVASFVVFFGVHLALLLGIVVFAGFMFERCMLKFSPFIKSDADAVYFFPTKDNNGNTADEGDSGEGEVEAGKEVQQHPPLKRSSESPENKVDIPTGNSNAAVEQEPPTPSKAMRLCGHADELSVARDILARYTVSGLFNVGSYAITGVFFTAMLLVRGCGVGNFDEVPTGQRWWSVCVWFLIAFASCAHSLGGKQSVWEVKRKVQDGDYDGMISSDDEADLGTVTTISKEEAARMKEADDVPSIRVIIKNDGSTDGCQSNPQAHRVYVDQRVQYSAVFAGNAPDSHCEPPSSVPTNSKFVAAASARTFVAIVVSVFFIIVGFFSAFDGTPATPPLSRVRFNKAMTYPKRPYAICNTRWGPSGRFNVTDMILLSKAAYYPTPELVDHSLKIWFDEPLHVSDETNWISNVSRIEEAPENSTTNVSSQAPISERSNVGVRAYHVVFREVTRAYARGLPADAALEPWMSDTKITYPRVDVIIVRGSNNGIDWLQNGYVWGDSVFFSLFNILTPFLLPHSVISSLILWSKSLRYGVFGDISYFNELKKLTRLVIADVGENKQNGDARGSNDVIIVGHSLGGGMAQLIGSALQIDSFAVSGVGVGYQSETADFEIEDVRRHQTNVAAASDIVPKIDQQLGDLQRIACDHNFLSCHSLTNVWDEMARSCSDLRDIHDSDSKSSSGIWEIASQFIIWLIAVIGGGFAYSFGVIRSLQKIFIAFRK